MVIVLFDVLCWVNKIMRFCYDSFVVNLCIGNKKCNCYDWFDGIYDQSYVKYQMFEKMFCVRNCDNLLYDNKEN